MTSNVHCGLGGSYRAQLTKQTFGYCTPDPKDCIGCLNKRLSSCEEAMEALSKDVAALTDKVETLKIAVAAKEMA